MLQSTDCILVKHRRGEIFKCWTESGNTQRKTSARNARALHFCWGFFFFLLSPSCLHCCWKAYTLYQILGQGFKKVKRQEFNPFQADQNEVNSFGTSVQSNSPLRRKIDSLIFLSAPKPALVLLNLIANKILHRSWKDKACCVLLVNITRRKWKTNPCILQMNCLNALKVQNCWSLPRLGLFLSSSSSVF